MTSYFKHGGHDVMTCRKGTICPMCRNWQASAQCCICSTVHRLPSGTRYLAVSPPCVMLLARCMCYSICTCLCVSVALCCVNLKYLLIVAWMPS